MGQGTPFMTGLHVGDEIVQVLVVKGCGPILNRVHHNHEGYFRQLSHRVGTLLKEL